MDKNKIVIVGSGLDFHALDWYRSIKKVCYNREVLYLTDMIKSEGKDKIINRDDNVTTLFKIDNFLFRNQSNLGNIWRNLVKIFFFKIQVRRLKKFAIRHPNAIYHAHTMYYMLLCWKADIKFIGSPQGDEILIRPNNSKIYKYFAVKGLKAADRIIVDSLNLKNGIKTLSKKDSTVMQYGIDVFQITKHNKGKKERLKVVSIRALYPLYRIHEIFHSRKNIGKKQPLVLFYPFWEDKYKEKIINLLQPDDINLNRIPTKNAMYDVLASTLLAISIPSSDSSPRSVYESIFSGCCVATTYNPWIESLPNCMRKRIYLVNLDDPYWLDQAIQYAKDLVKKPYSPTEEALEKFDQTRSMTKVVKTFYN